jgi:hypothetical protein
VPKARFNKGSGEATGSVLDFFSPPVANANSNLFSPGHLIPAQYPIRSACESNWVIVITTGQEVKPEDSTSYEYTTAQAIKNLYDATNKETKDPTVYPRTDNGDRIDGGKIYAPYEQVAMLVRDNAGNPKGDPKLVDLDDPIRTLVVGVVPDPKDVPEGPVRDEVKRMHLNLTRMAVAGRGGNPDAVTESNMHLADFQPFIASDVATLTQAIKDAMVVINDSNVVQPAKGAVAQARAIDASEDTSDLFTYKYRIMRSNQWQAELRRYVVSTEDDDVYVEHKWEIGKRVGTSPRAVSLWHPNALTSSLVTLTETDASFKDYTALNEDNISPPGDIEDFGGVDPAQAFVKWFNGSDYSYKRAQAFNRTHLLTDFGQGATVVVQNPASGDFLPGYKAWVTSLSAAAPSVLYGQTNDGLLHLVNHGTGSTMSTIVPPPSLLPKRLGVLTTLPAASGDKRQWVSILGPETVGGFRSYPAYTLDGALQRREFDLNQTGVAGGWGSYLLGALGRGGSGLYMLDVSSHSNPSFMWYKERVGNYLVRSNGASLEAVSSFGGTDPEKAWMKMGFNSPRPLMGVTHYKSGMDDKPQNFIALAGGAQFKRNPDQNGNDGATLLILDPKDGSVIKSFTGDSLPSSWRIGSGVTGKLPYMGMMVSDPTLLSSKREDEYGKYLVGAMLAADNVGNIFRVDMEKEDGAPLDVSDWGIKTIATLLKTSEISGGTAKSYAMPHGIAVGKGRGHEWAAGGTADVQVMKEATDEYEEGYIRNNEQLFFAFKTSKAQSSPYRRSNDFKALNDTPDSDYNPNHTGAQPDASFSGWYITLKPGTAEHFGEYVSTKPVLINGMLYVATFNRKGKTIIEDSSVCVTGRKYDGDSRLFAIDVSTSLGSSKYGWNALSNGKIPKYVEFKGVKIVSLTKMENGAKDKLLINFDIINEQSNNIEAVTTEQNNLLDVKDKDTGDPVPDMKAMPTPPDPSEGTFPHGVRLLHYWIREDGDI